MLQSLQALSHIEIVQKLQVKPRHKMWQLYNGSLTCGVTVHITVENVYINSWEFNYTPHVRWLQKFIAQKRIVYISINSAVCGDSFNHT